MTARPALDSRTAIFAEAVWDVTRVVDRPYRALGDNPVKGFADEDGAKVLALIESAGLLVLDPSSETLVERIARWLAPDGWDLDKYMPVSFGQTENDARDRLKLWASGRARDLLRTLAAPGGEPNA